MFDIDSSTLKNDDDEENDEPVRFRSMYKKSAKPMDLRIL